MSFNESIRQIVRAHLAVLVIFTATGLGVAYAGHATSSAWYSASVRLALGDTVPKSAAESQALAATARAFVTSTSLVGAAVDAAGLSATREVDEIAKDRIAITALGTSNVVQLRVFDPDPTTAASLANAIAAECVRQWTAAADAGTAQALATVDAQRDSLTSDLAELDRQIDQLAGAGAERTASVSALTARRDDLSRRAAALEAQRSQLLVDEAGRGAPWLLQAAAAPQGPEPSGLRQDLVVGALAGLLLGGVVAGAVELVRPSLRGSSVLATVMDLPLLAELSLGGGVVRTGGGELLRRLELVAAARHLSVVAVAPIGWSNLSAFDPGALVAGLLASQLPSARSPLEQPHGIRAPTRTQLRRDALADPPAPSVASVTPRNDELAGPGRTGNGWQPALHLRLLDELTADDARESGGFVIVAPDRFPSRQLRALDDLRRLVDWPFLGLATVQTPHWPRRVAAAAARRADRHRSAVVADVSCSPTAPG